MQMLVIIIASRAHFFINMVLRMRRRIERIGSSVPFQVLLGDIRLTVQVPFSCFGIVGNVALGLPVHKS